MHIYKNKSNNEIFVFALILQLTCTLSYLFMLRQFFVKDVDHVWLGGSDESGIWRWKNPTADMNFTDFSTGEPNKDAAVNCLVFWVSAEGYKWGDNDCYRKHRFICSKTS